MVFTEPASWAPGTDNNTAGLARGYPALDGARAQAEHQSGPGDADTGLAWSFRTPAFHGADTMKHLITPACLLVALGFYAAGMASGMVVFAGVGVLAEGTFWFRLFRRKPRKASVTTR
jgi:hypothetical protein